jgi:hypothetical protein
MTFEHDLEVATRKSRERRIWRIGFLISAGIHLLIFILFPVATISVAFEGAAGPNRGDFRAAEGTSQLLSMTSAPPEPFVMPVIPEPIVEPETDAFVPEPEPQVDLTLPSVDETGVGSTTGTDPDDRGVGGLAGAPGDGSGGTRGVGISRLVPPSPRGMIMPPANRDLRGQEVEVWVFVNEAGRVVADSTRLSPPTTDRGFNEHLARDAAQWIFEPARQDGLPIAAWFPYTIGLD